jgi:hypothetical protein
MVDVNNNIQVSTEQGHDEQSQEHGDDEREDFGEPGYVYDETDQNSWTPSGEMAKLPTEIFKKNLLSATTRKSILQNEPKNRNISFTPPDYGRLSVGHGRSKTFD